MPNEDAALGTSNQIDVVDTDRHVGNHPQPRGDLEQFTIDSLGQHAVKSVGIRYPGEEFVARDDAVLGPKLNAARIRQKV